MYNVLVHTNILKLFSCYSRNESVSHMLTVVKWEVAGRMISPGGSDPARGLYVPEIGV